MKQQKHTLDQLQVSSFVPSREDVNQTKGGVTPTTTIGPTSAVTADYLLVTAGAVIAYTVTDNQRKSMLCPTAVALCATK